jgi:ribosome-associated heat shock protein Hsp15
MVALEHSESVRLDSWLWAARFFKTRRLASAAVSGGKVHIDGTAAKSAKLLRGGECLQITRGEEQFEVLVRGLSARRGPAPVAQALYEETAPSVAARLARREQHRLQARGAPAKRPERRDRRRLTALKRGRD